MGVKGKETSITDAAHSFDQLNNKFFSKVTAGQIADGLDVFYSNFANRSIVISGAVWLVVNQIAGTPDVDQMILNYRKNVR